MGWLQKVEGPIALPATLAQQDAEAVLAGHRTLSPYEIEVVAQMLGREVQDLVFEDWPRADQGLVLRENIKRLLSGVGAQTKGKTAEKLGVSPQTLSRWLGGSQMPDTSAKRAIVTMFGLRDVEELEETPLFLSYLPVTHAERVAWLKSQLDKLSWDELKELFPALLKLFSETPRGF